MIAWGVLRLKGMLTKFTTFGPKQSAVRIFHGFSRSLIRLRERATLLHLRVATQPIFWRKPVPVEFPSEFFNSRDLGKLWGYIQRMMYADAYLLRRLSERRLEGLRSWEYGQLLGLIQNQAASRDWLVLDVGPGTSTFPAFLSSYVNGVITIDYPNPLEPPSPGHLQLWRQSAVVCTQGTMLHLPFRSGTFDLVTCISTIEHLDDPGTGEQRPYRQFIDLTQAGLREMLRMIRLGGYLYLTTDTYVPELQTTDNWSKKRPGQTIWSAYRIQDIGPIFLDTIVDEGFEIVGGCDYDPTLVIRDPSRSIYRGRYFTTFCIYARRGK